MTSDDAVLAVLKRLERENRQLKRFLATVFILFIVLVCTGMVWQNKRTPAIQDLIRTRRLELANAAGEVVAVLQTVSKKEEPGWLTEYYSNGRRKWRAKIEDNRYQGQYTGWWSSGIKSQECTYSK